MHWRDFERHCDELLRNAYPEPKYKISTGKMIRTSGRDFIPDFLIEREDGYKVVADAKCYQKDKRRIHTNTIDDMEEYLRRTNSDYAYILASGTATITEEALDYIKRFKCEIIRVGSRTIDLGI